MESTLTIRRFGGGDVDAVLALERVCPELAHWDRKDYQDVAIGKMEGWVAARGDAGQAGAGSNDEVSGFIVIRQVHHEVEILNLAVEPQERRKGVGARLLEEAMEHAAKNGAVRTFLEVRLSNEAALKLYRRYGFGVVGRRVGYYRAPVEDALTLATTMQR
jgi:[ribosomal protein S18]-alanine N-acetyltransferase